MDDGSNSTHLVANALYLEEEVKPACLSRQFYKCISTYYGSDDETEVFCFPETVNSQGVTGLALTFWLVGIIFLILVFIFCAVVFVGMAILVVISLQQHTSLQKSQQQQLKLLDALCKRLSENYYIHHQDYDDRIRNPNSRCCCSSVPFYESSRHYDHFPHQISNSPFHPRNNTPATSECNASFPSHASFSKSGPPSVSSISIPLSEDAQSEGSLEPDGFNAVCPGRESIFQRPGRENAVEFFDSEGVIIAPVDYIERNDIQVFHNRHEQLSVFKNQTRSGQYSQSKPPEYSSSKEYWL